MSEKMKTYFNWSGGKDSSLALYHALQNKDFSIEKLLTSVNKTYGRISMHGVREDPLTKPLDQDPMRLAVCRSASTQGAARVPAPEKQGRRRPHG